MKALVVDHEDSFVHNLVQGLSVAGARVESVRATEPIARAARSDPDLVVLSPGPGHPCDRRLTGMANALLDRWEDERSFLGVCLGHQVIGSHYGGRVVRAPEPVHGASARVRHDGRGLFDGLKNPLLGARYHSLVVARRGLPRSLELSAWDNDGLVMAVRHRSFAIESVQFHPESFLTPEGQALLANVVRGARR